MELIDPVILQSVNPEVPDAGGLQRIVAYIVMGIFVLGILVAARSLKQPALPGDKRSNAKRIRTQLSALNYRGLVVRKADFDPMWLRDKVRELQEGERVQEPARTAARRAAKDVKAAWSERGPDVPRLSVRLAWEAILVAFWGSIAVVSVESWRSAAQSGGEFPSIGDVTTAAGDVYDIGVSLVFEFPLFELVYALTIAYGIKFAATLYEHWAVIAVMLFAGAVIVAVLDRLTTRDLETAIIEDPRTALKLVIAGFVVVWFTGTLISTAIELAGFPEIGEWIGFAVALLVFIVLAGYATYRFAKGVRATHRELTKSLDYYFPETGIARHGEFLTAGLLVSWRAAAVIGIIAAPILMMYVFQAVATGKLLTIAGIIISAPLTTKLPIAIAILVLIILPFADDPGRWTDTKAAVSRAMSLQRVRLYGLLVGFPVGVVGIVIVIGWTFRQPLLPVVGAALVAGLVARLAGYALSSAKFRVSGGYTPTDRAIRTPARAVVDVPPRPLYDIDDRDIYTAKINGKGLAWPDRDRLIDRIVTDVGDIFDQGQRDPSVETYYYEQMKDRGLVDPDRVRSKLRSDIRKQIEQSINGDGLPERETVVEELKAEYDPDVVDDVMEYLLDPTTNQLIDRGGRLDYRAGAARSL